MELILINQNEDLKKKVTLAYSKTWMNPKYKFFHQTFYSPIRFDENGYDYEQYAVIKGEELIGFIDVSITQALYVASVGQAINFTDDIVSMGVALKQLIEMLFSRNFNKISWRGIDGNPIIPSYRKIAEKYGGRQESHERYYTKLWDGTVADSFSWGILKEEYDFVQYRSRCNRKIDRETLED